MTAKELADELLKYPDFGVEFVYSTFIQDGIHTPFPNISSFRITGIADIGHSDKVIFLDGESND